MKNRTPKRKPPKHTPGPWYVGLKPTTVYAAVASNRAADVTITEAPTEADARLIAAAPDMLDALLAIDAAMAGRLPPTTDFRGEVSHALAKVRTAIRHAEGGAV